MKKFLHFGDTHLGSSLQYGTIDPKTGINTRFQDYCNTFDFIVKTAIDEKVDIVLFAGDAFKNRNPSMTQQREFAKRIRALTKAKIPVVLITGNHDVCNDPSSATALEIFEILADDELVRVSSKPELFEINGLQIATLPWFNRSVAMQYPEFEGLSRTEINKKLSDFACSILGTLIAQADAEKPLIVMAHCTVSGAKFGQERDVMMGQDVVIPYSAFTDPKVCYAALGHIHRHQTVGEDHIVYSGSPDIVDFGEVDNIKCFVMGQCESGSRSKWQKINTPVRNFYIGEMLAIISKSEIGYPDSLENACAKFTIKGTKTELDAFDFADFEEKVKAKKPSWYSIKKEIVKEDREQEVSNYSEMSQMEIVKKYAEKKKIKKSELPDFTEKAREILDGGPFDEISIGHAGFIPGILSLKNFTSHESTNLNFDEFDLDPDSH